MFDNIANNRGLKHKLFCYAVCWFRHNATYNARPLSPHTTHTVIIQATHFSNSSYCALEWRNKVQNVHNSQSLKPYIIQQLYHKIELIPQTYINYVFQIACTVNAYLQTIIQDHALKKLHHACKWSQDGMAMFCKHQNCPNEEWSRSSTK